MSASVKRIYNPLAFSPQQQDDQVITTALADVFGRGERLPLSHGETRMITEHFRFGKQPITIAYPDYGSGRPKWLIPVITSICERWGTEPGWDSYDAKPTNIVFVSKLLDKLFNLMQHNSTPPIVTPLSDSGVQAEWHKGEETLELEVSANAPPTYYYYNETNDKSEEGEPDQNFSHLRELISKF